MNKSIRIWLDPYCNPVMTTTMGILTAVTTGWWGQFGDRHGRTKVIACAVSGLMFTCVDGSVLLVGMFTMQTSDIMFILASNPPAWFRGKAQQLLILASVGEGLLGGWSTLQAATHA